jgi:hypothetical protein
VCFRYGKSVPAGKGKGAASPDAAKVARRAERRRNALFVADASSFPEAPAGPISRQFLQSVWKIRERTTTHDAAAKCGRVRPDALLLSC